jgi:phytoene desaturase
MNKSRKVIIIGAGVGGLVTGIILARKGYQVTLFEKNASPGGRCGQVTRDGHRFDTGATFLMMPEVYERTYAAFGKDINRELQLCMMDPAYKIKFKGGKEISFTSDIALLQKQFEAIEPGSYYEFLKLLPAGYKAYHTSVRHVIDHCFSSFFDPAMFKQLYILLKYKALANHYRFISRHFRSEELRSLFTFQNLYVGQNPLNSPGIFFFMPFMELTSGVLYPRGGMHQIILNLVSIAQENNVEIVLNSPVRKIETGNRVAKGVIMEDSTFHQADIIVANADLPYAYNSLLPESKTSGRLNKMNYTCSAIVFHWGVDTVYPQLEQHNVFISGNIRDSFRTVFRDKSAPDDPTIYLHSPVKSDKSAAPPGHDSLSAIVHAGHVDEQKKQDWDILKEKARHSIMKRLALEGIDDLEEHIKFEICHTPDIFRANFNLTRGAVFGSLGHEINQMAYFRPRNQHRRYRNLYFVGGSTQPGSGIPLVLISSKLVTGQILKDTGNG